MFKKDGIVWAKKPKVSGHVWWPAVVDEDVVFGEETLIRFFGHKKRTRIMASNIANFDLMSAKDAGFNDRTLQAEVEKAVAMRSLKAVATVRCQRLDGQQQPSSSVRSQKWMEEFLESLEDEVDQISQHPSTPVKPKPPFRIKIKLSSYNVEDDDSDEDEEWDVHETASKHKLSNSMSRKRIREEHPLLADVKNEEGKIKTSVLKRTQREDSEELSEYEKIRQRNIAQRQSLFASLKIASAKQAIAPIHAQVKPIRKCRRIHCSRREPYDTRGRLLNSGGTSPVSTTPMKKTPWIDEFGKEFRELPKRFKRYCPRQWARNPNQDALMMVDNVTEVMIKNVIYKSGNKVYCSTSGTTCHQCRQKTIDTKTVCRSGHCVGVRGQFCGFCLLNRYGQLASDALKDPKWECPPCRGICNCSICRSREGKLPTGPMIHKALSSGFSGVSDYLESLSTDKHDEIFIDDKMY